MTNTGAIDPTLALSGPTSPEYADVGDRLWRMRFDCLRNAHYHKARQRRLEFWGRATNFLVVVLGTSAAADFTSATWGLWPSVDGKIGATAFGFFVAVIGALQLVYDWSGRARTHEFLQRRFFETIAKIEELPSLDEAALKKIDAELIRVYADEPPTLRALDSIAYNETVDALGNPGDRLVIRWWHSLFRHTFPFSDVHFPTVREVNAAKTGS